MLILAIDTTTKISGVALYSLENGLLGEINLNSGKNHSENIMVVVDNLFKLTNVLPNDIDKIAVSTGPGSFTGIRIGVAVAKGLGYSLKKEIVGINELDVIANLSGRVHGNMQVMAMIDARKERVYYGKYKEINGKLTLISNYLDGELREILKYEKDKKTLFLGDAAHQYKSIISEIMGENAVFYSKALSIPRGAVVAELSIEKKSDNLMTLEPFYISKTQAEREKSIKENRE